jgi:hypothetical protein
MGEDAGAIRSPALLNARVTGCAVNAQVILVRNGKALAKAYVQDGAVDVEVKIPIGDVPVRAWYRVDVVDAANQALAISNPIFLGPPRPPPPNPYGRFAEELARQ